eukprot:5126-Heterococcus_DN1.PRE.1
MDACSKGGEVETSLQLLAEMLREGLMPNEVSYNCAIAACAQAGDWRSGVDLLAEMRETGNVPTV